MTPLFTWIQSGSFDAQWALQVDAMTAVMLVVITSVALLGVYYLRAHPANQGLSVNVNGVTI